MDDLGFHDALAMLDWQIALGADEAILDAPIDRFALADQPPLAPAAAIAPKAGGPVAPPPVDAAPPALAVDAVALAQAAADAAPDLPALCAAMADFPHCPLRETATRLVFADGLAGARVMILGEAPGRDEEQQGKPFVGQAGQLLDRMLAAIGLDRAATDPARAVYIANVVPWRPPQNRRPTPEELAMMAPFMHRHIAFAAPEIVVLMGNAACEAMLGQTGGTRLRGTWLTLGGRPALPMLHPGYLFRRPHDKALAWADLLSLQARLRGMS
jgi:uracil-DNA glycosylase